MNADQMKERTKRLAIQIVLFCRALPYNREGKLIGNQLFRCGTSVAANYRASCRARSKADFIAKMGIVEEEADETMFWLDMLKTLKLGDEKETLALLHETEEVLAITVSSIRTARERK
jgi:four helix bundle protein